MCFLLQCDNELKYWVDGTRHGGENADYVAASQLDAVLSEVNIRKYIQGVFYWSALKNDLVSDYT